MAVCVVDDRGRAEVDAVLWEMCYRHLPYVMDMDLSVADRVYLKHAAL